MPSQFIWLQAKDSGLQNPNDHKQAASWAWLESLKTMTFTFYKISIITLQHRSNARAFQLVIHINLKIAYAPSTLVTILR